MISLKATLIVVVIILSSLLFIISLKATIIVVVIYLVIDCFCLAIQPNQDGMEKMRLFL